MSDEVIEPTKVLILTCAGPRYDGLIWERLENALLKMLQIPSIQDAVRAAVLSSEKNMSGPKSETQK